MQASTSINFLLFYPPDADDKARQQMDHLDESVFADEACAPSLHVQRQHHRAPRVTGEEKEVVRL